MIGAFHQFIQKLNSIWIKDLGMKTTHTVSNILEKLREFFLIVSKWKRPPKQDTKYRLQEKINRFEYVNTSFHDRHHKEEAKYKCEAEKNYLKQARLKSRIYTDLTI